MRCYVGWDPRDVRAYNVAVHSFHENLNGPATTIPIVEGRLREQGIYWRSYHVDHRGQMWDDRDGTPFSTQFSFTRFAIPIIEDYKDEWVLFTDADVMWRANPKELFDLVDDKYAVMCVKHNHEPPESIKMDGVLQSRYKRKNWSSVFLMNPSKCKHLTKYALNNWSGSDLHRFTWVEDEMIGEIPEAWNWLEGWSDPAINPKLVHYTRGTPDMKGYEDVPYALDWWAIYSESEKYYP